MSGAPLSVYLIAGEASGDLLGARLMAGLRARLGDGVTFHGIGGEEMTAQGLRSLFPMGELSVMGLAEILPHIPHLLARIRQTVADVEARRPDVLVTIDSPGFCFRVAKRLVGRGIPLVHYVAPTVWAWKPGRARKVAAFLDHLLVLLPFEPPYFQAEGLATTFVGHPVVDGGADRGDGPAFRTRHGIPADAPLLCVLPGSRRGEVLRLLPPFGDTVRRLAADVPGLHVVVPTVDWVADGVAAGVADWPVPVTLVRGVGERFDAFAAADAALAASGTVALELALARVPAVIAYLVKPATAFLLRRLVRVRFVNLVNILLDREAVPECLQERCDPAIMAPLVRGLLTDPAVRAEQMAAADRALDMLGRGGPSPGQRAADAVLEVLGRAP
ncbi:MAG: lipid-A-disaccharide synthase [Rhodobacterales bacterium]|nr:lipid-A-disaccharide synthase [Rhodobacterales bacterium]